MAVEASHMKNRQLNLVDAKNTISLSEFDDSVDSFSIQRNQGGEFSLLALKKVLYTGTLANEQNVLIADCSKYGRVLLIDGELQGAELDERLYHELLVHPAMLSHPNPRRILIIGGADGAAAREALKHRCVETLTIVTPDEQMLELAKTYLPTWNEGAFKNERVKVVVAKARDFIQSDSGKYDLIIFDQEDLDLAAEDNSHYTKQFFQLAKARLAPGGIFAIQANQIAETQDEHFLLRKTVGSIFAETHSYHAVIPSFLTDWGFLLASDWVNPKKMSEKVINDMAGSRLGAESLRYVDGEFLLSCFLFPKQVRSKMNECCGCLEDA